MQFETGSPAASLRAYSRAASVAFMLLGHLLRTILRVSVMELWSKVHESLAGTRISVNGRGVEARISEANFAAVIPLAKSSAGRRRSA